MRPAPTAHAPARRTLWARAAGRSWTGETRRATGAPNADAETDDADSATPDARTSDDPDAATEDTGDEGPVETDTSAAPSGPAGDFAFPPLPDPEEETPDPEEEEETPIPEEEVVPTDPCSPDYQEVESCFGTDPPAFVAYDFQPQSCGFGATYGLDACP